jgi:hypothetical protein
MPCHAMPFVTFHGKNIQIPTATHVSIRRLSLYPRLVTQTRQRTCQLWYQCNGMILMIQYFWTEVGEV